eukprot:scaffold120130_cov54-Phaeocystis_antarctica.AAC.2
MQGTFTLRTGNPRTAGTCDETTRRRPSVRRCRLRAATGHRGPPQAHYLAFLALPERLTRGFHQQVEGVLDRGQRDGRVRLLERHRAACLLVLAVEECLGAAPAECTLLCRQREAQHVRLVARRPLLEQRVRAHAGRWRGTRGLGVRVHGAHEEQQRAATRARAEHAGRRGHRGGRNGTPAPLIETKYNAAGSGD